MSEMTSIVQTTAGPVRGFIDTHPLSDRSTASLPASTCRPVQKFLGIPFGRAERWRQARPARPAAPWTETRECREYGPACPQPKGLLTPILAKASRGFHPRDHIGVSETEMFTVNVYAADGVREGDRVPVMVWIYGGSWKDGAASGLMYDPTNVVRSASERMIVVTLNYRVNIFGFFASQDLVDEDGLVGNYGIRDQLLALKWVNQNIGRFGGDRENVTVFGESAGACSVGWHIGGVDPLFRRAITQSGAASTMGYQTMAQHEKMWRMLLEHFGISLEDVDRVEKARAIPTTDLLTFLAKNPTLQWAATVESGPNAIWSAHPDVRTAKGEYISSLESLMLGCTTDEGSIFAQFFGMVDSQETTGKFVDAFGEASQHIKMLYPGIDEVAKYQGALVDHPVSRFLHDALFDGPVRFLAETLASTPHAKTGRKVDVYLYKSEAVLPSWKKLGWGAHHFSEVPFVFNSSSLWEDDEARPEAKVAANYVSKWTSFASHGRPSLNWPKFTEEERRRLVLQEDGRDRVEDVSEGASEMGLLLFSKVIKARWGIEEKKNSTMSKM